MTANAIRPLKNLELSKLVVDQGHRPKMPKLAAAQDHHRRQGRQLAAIHRMHLRDMAQIGQLIPMIANGERPPAELKSALGNLDLAQNMRLFGNLCGRECQVLTFHHNAEEDMIFPQLEQQNIDALTQVVARLRQEHLVVHELLLRLEAAAQTIITSPIAENFAQTRVIFEQLWTCVLSHFRYEETELQEALGLYVPVI